jgi:rhodanese-related sulfurtransferase
MLVLFFYFYATPTPNNHGLVPVLVLWTGRPGRLVEEPTILVRTRYDRRVCSKQRRMVNIGSYRSTGNYGNAKMNHFSISRVNKTLFKRLLSNITEVKSISVGKFQEILKSNERSEFQIVDVREKFELKLAAIQGDDILNLPLSSSSEWAAQLLEGTHPLLHKDKPTLCMCHHGVRSMSMAVFLG